MSRHASQERTVTIAENNDALAVIREEQSSPASSSVNIDDTKSVSEERQSCPGCCARAVEPPKGMDSEEVEKLLLDKEIALREEFQQRLQTEISKLKERFDFILQNEEVRASYMLREAHRERQEKITALQAQLECKNLAGLMFVLCSERRKSELEKLRLVEEYTSDIRALQQILAEGQYLLLHLSRGYKTAARVDREWREKMVKVMREVFDARAEGEGDNYGTPVFQAYVLHFSGGTPETNQYFLNLPALLKTEAPIRDNPNEDPCETGDDGLEELHEIESETNKAWFELLDGECRPFVMFGDMAEFKPPQRRQVLGAVKAAKTAPRHWKEYVFNEMFLRTDCSNANAIKDEYPKRLPPISKWECIGVQTEGQSSRGSYDYQRCIAASIDRRANMGSILKIITSGVGQPTAKSNLLGARDSMEIASTTKLRERHRQSESSKVVLDVRKRRAESLKDDLEKYSDIEDQDDQFKYRSSSGQNGYSDVDVEEEEDGTMSYLGSGHNDSLSVRISRLPERDSKIHYEKVCPMEQCKRMQVDSFVRCLPPYMRASPFTHFEQTYDDYETCSPEQLEILRQRIEDKKKKNKSQLAAVEDVLNEWSPDVEGVGVQTSPTSSESLPPCTCLVPNPTPVSSAGKIFNMADLIPVKQTLDAIRRNCFYDNDIEFDRFKVLGEDMSKDDVKGETTEGDFTKKRLHEIKKILKKHPSLCEIFQANTQC